MCEWKCESESLQVWKCEIRSVKVKAWTCIYLKLQNTFVLNCKLYFYQISKYVCLNLPNVFVSNSRMPLSQISKCICIKLQSLFIPNYLMYLFQIAKCVFFLIFFCLFSVLKWICLKLPNSLVSHCLIHLS